MCFTTFRAARQRDTADAEKGANTMKAKRVKYIHTTPKSQTVSTEWNFDLGGGFDRLLKAVARVIEKHFGLLYVHTSTDVFR